MSPKNRCLSMAFFLAFAFPLSAGQKKPAWIDGPDPKYPETKYLTGVGIGSDLDGARSNARAEIARTFQARIQQTLTDRQTESSTSAGNKRAAAQGTQKSQIDTQLSTDALLEGVAVVETFVDPKSNKTYALAVLDKVALRRTLSDQILEQEHRLAAAKGAAEAATTPLGRARALSSALEAARERDALASRRRVVDPAGLADPSAGTTAALESALEKTIAAIPLSVTAEAPKGSKLREAVVAQINGIGVPVSNASTPGLAVKAKMDVTPFERNVPEWTFFQWAGTVELTDQNTGKVVASITKDGVEGHLTPSSAKLKAIAAGETALGQEAASLVSDYLFGSK